MSLTKNRIKKLGEIYQERFDEKYYYNNFDKSLDEFCSQDSGLEYDINLLVYLFNKYDLDLTFDYSVFEPESPSFGAPLKLKFHKALDVDSVDDFYQHEDEFIRKTKKFILENNPGLEIDEEEIKILISNHANDKYKPIKTLYHNEISRFFAAKSNIRGLTAEEYLKDEDNFFQDCIKKGAKITPEYYYENFYEKYSKQNW